MSTLLSKDNATIFLICETHLRNDMNDSEILRHLPNYSLVRCDRNPNYDNDSLTKKGGVAVLYPSNLCITKATFLSSGEKKSGLYRYCWPGVVTAVSQSHKIVWGISIAEESLKLLPNHPLQCL